ncbi:unnamed protein product, partial [marine sediment metagenome]
QGAVFYTNAIEKSCVGAGAYETIDCSVQAPSAVMLFLHAYSCPVGCDYAVRRNGSAEDIYYDASCQFWAFVECDANQRIEGKVEALTMDFFVMGYATSIL